MICEQKVTHKLDVTLETFEDIGLDGKVLA